MYFADLAHAIAVWVFVVVRSVKTSRTAVSIDLVKSEPKSCAHEYNCVVRLPTQPVKKLYLCAQLFDPHFAR